MPIQEVLLDTLSLIDTKFEKQIDEIKIINRHRRDFEYDLNSILRKYDEANNNEKTEILKSANLYSTLRACIDYIKKINREMQIYNDYVSRLATFEVSNSNCDNQINTTIRKCQELSDLITNNYTNLIRMSHDFLEYPNEEVMNDISRAINNINCDDIEYLYTNIETNVTEITQTLKNAIYNDSFNITIVADNYNPIKTYDKSTMVTNNFIRNSLGNNSNVKVTNGLKVPDVSLDDLINYAYRIHNQEYSNGVALDNKTTFSDDEFLYQEFLSYVTFKMRENEPNLSLKLEGLSLSEKREMLEKYKNDTIKEITANITINGNVTSLNQYILEASSILYILRINGYNIEKKEDMSTYIRNNKTALLIKDTPLDQTALSNDFKVKYKKCSLDDANILKILNDGRALTENEFNETEKVIDRINQLKDMASELLNERNPQRQQEIINNILNVNTIGLMNNNSYDIETIYRNGIYSPEQFDNFNMLISNANSIVRMGRTSLNQIRYKLYKRFNSNQDFSEELKIELCNQLIDDCNEILENSSKIIDKYKEENNIGPVENETFQNNSEMLNTESEIFNIEEEIQSLEESKIFNIEEEIQSLEENEIFNIEEEIQSLEKSEIFTPMEELELAQKASKFKKNEELDNVKQRKSKKAQGIYSELNENNKRIYDSIMQKSYTQILNKLDKNELSYLTNVFKDEVNKIMIKSANKNILSEADIEYIAIYTKLNNRYKKVFNKENSEITENRINHQKLDQQLDSLFEKTDKATKHTKGR